MVREVDKSYIESLGHTPSEKLKPVLADKFLEASITIHCKPKHNPNVGILFSLANRMASSFPGIPRYPNPPGTRIPLTPASTEDAFPGLISSLSIRRTIIRA